MTERFITGLQEALTLPPVIYFQCGYVKDMVFRPPLPATIEELKQEITEAILTLTPEMLQRVWNEFENRVYITRVSVGGRIEHLRT